MIEFLQSILTVVSIIVSLLAIFGITLVLEKRTIKLKPWTAIRKWLVGDLDTKVIELDTKIITIKDEQQRVKDELKIEQQKVKDDLRTDIKSMDSKLDELTIERYMTDITDFASEINNDVPKDEAQRRLIIEKIDKYENYYHKNGYVAIKGQLIKERCAEDNCGNEHKPVRKNTKKKS